MPRVGEEQGELVYAGSAFVTTPQPERDRFWATTEAVKVNRPAVKMETVGRKASYGNAELRVRARHLRADGVLRHASLTELLCTPRAIL